ncbi:MAG: response regulator [Planctomycetes bacterium]|nr:response regulator [Planctomycetota bacterium]
MTTTPRTKKILIADDDPYHRDILRRLLNGIGEFDIVEADSGSDTFTRVNLDHPDLVLLDWMMPFMDGLDILRELRSAGDQTPVVMVTAKADAASRARALETGANGVVTKPYSISEMRKTLHRYLSPPSDAAAGPAADSPH